jgi:hypothetical protein
MKTHKKIAGLTLGIVLAGAGMAPAGVVVYSNFANDQHVNFDPGTSEVGDEVTMATLVGGQTGVTLSEFQFNLWAKGYTGNPTINAQVRFYRNDGPLYGGVPTPGALPFWDSTVFPITIQTMGGGAVVSTDTTYYNILFDTDVAGLLVPNDFTWTLALSGLGTGQAGVLLYSPPTVGGNYADYWLNTGGNWTLNTNNNPAIIMDFAAAFAGTPVPEASPVLMSVCVLLGVGGFVVRRRLARSGAAQA